MKRKHWLAVIAVVPGLLIGLYAAAWCMARYVVHEQLTQLVAAGLYEKADYQWLWLSPLDGVVVSGVTLAQPDLNLVIDRIRLHDVDWFHTIPRHLAIAIDNIRFPDGPPKLSDNDNTIQTRLLNLAVKNNILQVHLDYGYHYDPARSEQTVHTASMSMPGYFALQVAGETRHLPLADLLALKNASSDESAMMQHQLLAIAVLAQASLNLHDSGLVDAVVNGLATDSHSTAADMRVLLASQLQNYYRILPDNLQGLARQSGSELAKLLAGGRTLSISVSPAFDGSLTQLQQELMGTVLTGNYDKAAKLLQFSLLVR